MGLALLKGEWVVGCSIDQLKYNSHLNQIIGSPGPVYICGLSRNDGLVINEPSSGLTSTVLPRCRARRPGTVAGTYSLWWWHVPGAIARDIACT